MDQNNPLAGLAHKHRLSVLGSGGFSRDRTNMEVCDVHSSYYDRMCSIETPEGLDIGLIGSPASFARINPFDLIETPCRMASNGAVMDEIVYLQADDEDRAVVAQAEMPLDKNNHLIDGEMLCRMPGDGPALAPVGGVDSMDISAQRMYSVGTAMIPFLEHDDANRTLMGTSMRRQAIPLIRPPIPYMGTGTEMRSIVDAGGVTVTKKPGVILEVDADSAAIEQDDGRHVTYKLAKFGHSNPGSCTDQQVVVSPGDRLKAGTLITDGPATKGGELALGQNLFVAFMTWNGFNYEDAIILSERCVKDDLLTSIHTEEHEVGARDTELRPEEIARGAPNIPGEMFSHLSEHGVIWIDVEVRVGDVPVGKITPRDETELTSEERLLRAIFGGRAKKVRDASLRVPHGESGIAIGVRRLTKGNNDEPTSDVNKTVRVYVAQRRKITVSDKITGRRRNKGVTS